MRRLSLVLPLFFLACGGSSEALSGPGGPSIAVDITVEQGAAQQAPPQTVMPDSVVARATDDAGNPMEDQVVNLEIPAGAEAGTFDADVLQTNANGRVFAELTAGTRAWTSRVAAGEDSAYTARLVASRGGRPDEIAKITFAVQPDDLAELDFGVSEVPVIRAGEDLNVLERIEWPGRDAHANPIPGSMIADREASWVYRFKDVEGSSGTGWDAGPVPELHREGWVDINGIRRVEDPSTLPDSMEARGQVEWTTGEISDWMWIDALLPACWEHTRTLDDGREEFETVEWTEGCPAPEDQV